MKLFEEIVQQINEELGVSDLVTNTTNNIISAIIKDNKINKKFKGRIENFNVFGINISVIYQIYVVNTINDIINIVTDNPGRTDRTLNIYTTIVYVKELNKYIDYNGTTQHEIEHLYQTIKSKKLLLHPESADMYKTACNLVEYGSTIYDGIVGYVVYYNNKFEKDAFANDTYRQIIDNPREKPIEIVKNTDVYQNIGTISRYVNSKSSKVKQKIEDVTFKNFGKHYNWWLNMAKKVIANYKNKMGKVIVKAEKDLYGEDSLITLNKRLK